MIAPQLCGLAQDEKTGRKSNPATENRSEDTDMKLSMCLNTNTKICFVLLCADLLFEELVSGCGCPHGAAMKRACQQPPPVFVCVHVALAPDGQSLFPGHVDQR